MANRVAEIKSFKFLLKLVAGQDISQGEQLRDTAFTVPNGLSLFRLLLIPVILLLLIENNIKVACLLFAIAMITDLADGFIAKRFDAQTRLGAFLDPIADKCLLMSVYFWLSYNSLVADWLAMLVISRDLFILIGFLVTLLAFNRAWVAPLAVGKLTTFLQYILAGLIVFKEGFMILDAGLAQFIVYAIYLIGGLTFLSLLAYALQWFVRIVISIEDVQ